MQDDSSWFTRAFPDEAPDELGDFTTTLRVIPIAGVATAIGAIGGVVALALSKLIFVFTNLFFFQRLSAAAAVPARAAADLGWKLALVPVAGALVIGFMARYGSERIRGHGIPEALESILIRGSRVEGKLAILKPLSAAISIGSGGPFGAEGPIIMTGGAFGSLIAQVFHLTSAERKTLLVAGAAAGMSATFATPVAATLLAVELLLFEYKPRSFVPVALASASAAATRWFLFGPGPLFPVPAHHAFVGVAGLSAAAIVGLAAGALSALLTVSVYFWEDRFKQLRRLHWMWWPALGGVVIGVGGLVEPRALGVGYDCIGALLNGELGTRETLLLMLTKWVIWSVALGSGTSGGVLAPLLILGGALGALESHFLPWEGAGFWTLISMGAILGGTMRSPLTGIVFAVELTHDLDALLPLSVAVALAHLFTVLVLRRSILTEKVARRGVHLTREYAIDPLEVLFVQEVMQRGVEPPESAPQAVYADDTLRMAVLSMAKAGVTVLAVRDRDGGSSLGVITLRDTLQASVRHLEEETRRERVLPIHLLWRPFASVARWRDRF